MFLKRWENINKEKRDVPKNIKNIKREKDVKRLGNKKVEKRNVHE